MRERTPFGRALIDKLPNLKFVSLTGARSPSLDTQALKERGIPVSNTRSAGGGLSTVELTWGLIISAARGLAKGERNMRAGRWHEGLGARVFTGGKNPRPARSGQHRRARGGDRQGVRHGMRGVEPESDRRRRRQAPVHKLSLEGTSCFEIAMSSPSTSCWASARAAWCARRTWR